ncbi:MAG: type II toxin-antitoxin system VapC family toxin [Anaerolineae bacterium]|nr:type II toxin-antitoxin system VapC family toxin [Anaerolineae bacterium]
MIYSLDTNTCIRYINGRSLAIRHKLPTIPARDIVVCSIVRGELAYGAAKSQTPGASAAKQARFLKPYVTLFYDDSAAQEYGRIRAYLEKAGTPIGPYDMQIAAIAVVHGLIIVTHNTNEFGRIPGLKIEDWEA